MTHQTTEPSSERAELKPCPFCGHVGIDFHEGSTFRWIVAECAKCGAQTGEVRVQTIGDGTPEEWMQKAKQEAIREWNTRALLAATPAREWVGLTDVEIASAMTGQPEVGISFQALCNIARAIEAKLREKNATTPSESGGEAVAWALSDSRGLVFSSHYPMCKSKDVAEKFARRHFGATVRVVPLYTHPQPQPVPDDVVKDAERMDWIARQGDEFTSRILVDCPGDGNYYVSGGYVSGEGETFRAAIDAAMLKEGK